MNHYMHLNSIKRTLDITDTSQDEKLFDFAEEASRIIDEYCNRFFYVKKGQMIVDLDYTSTDPYHILFPWDVLSVSKIELDTDMDLEFDDDELTASEYILLPRNDYPKTAMDIDHGYNGYLGTSPCSIRLTGEFGYGDGLSSAPYINRGLTILYADEDSSTIEISSATAFSPGMTILAGTEQMFINTVTEGTPDTASVIRAVNGTEADVHPEGTIAYVFQYPAIVRRVCTNIVSVLRNTSTKQGLSGESISDYSYSMSGSINVSSLGGTRRASSSILSELDNLRRMV